MRDTALEPVSASLVRLPTPLTPFVGRSAEYIQVIDRLADPACHLITITGPGGSGKTRLAIEVIRRFAGSAEATRFVHGIFFVSLAALVVDEPLSDVPAIAIANELNLSFDGPETPQVQLQQALRDRHVLLVLDNAEHIRSGALFVAELLQAAPQITIVATSHEPLGLRGEWVVPLQGLQVPAKEISSEPAMKQYAAIELFTQNARMVAPDFLLNEQTLPSVVQICRLVDGLPLGIELAANWLRVLSCTEIAAEISQNFDILASDSHDLAVRQRSLRAVFTYAWSLLTEPEQQVLRQLSVFRGSFTREAATAVAGSPLAYLASLVNKSLVRRVGGVPTVGTSVRYELTHPLRQYASEELVRSDEFAATKARHAAFYTTFLAGCITGLRGPQQRETLAAIDAEIEAIRAAWRWAVDSGNYQALAAAAPSLFHFYDMRSRFQEGAIMFAAASGAFADRHHEPELGPVWGMLLAYQAWFVFLLGRQHEARDLLTQSVDGLRTLNAEQQLIFPLNYLGAVWSYLGNYTETERLCAESLALTDRHNDEYSRAVACNILGQAAYERGDYQQARVYHEQSLAIEERIGNRWSMAFSLINLGKIATRMGRYNEAQALFEQSLRIREELADQRGISMCYHRLGEAALAHGDLAAASTYYTRSLTIAQSIANRWGVTNALIQLGKLAVHGRVDSAAACLFRTALPQVMETAATPQLWEIFAASAELLQRYGASDLAAAQAALTARAAPDMHSYKQHVASLGAWMITAQHGRTLDAAINEVVTALAAIVPPAESGSPLSGLTPRELEVLRLVARGLTDAQIADQLVVSPRTINTHLTSVYGKLQVNSRSAATRLALEHGLL